MPKLCAISFALVALTACDAPPSDTAAEPFEPPELPFRYTTADLHIHADTQRCEGDLARWQAFVDFASAYLGVAPSTPIEVYLWDQQADFSDLPYCGGVVGGCLEAASGRVYTTDASLEHELVHALVRAQTNTDAFFSEGLAVALAGPTAFGPYPPAFPVASPAEVDYVSAGHFVRWLLEREGPAAVLAHMRGPGELGDFEARFGSYPALVDDFYASAPDTHAALHDPSVPTLELLDEGLWFSALELSCSASDVRGGHAGLEIVRELTLSESGVYSLWSSTKGSITARLDTPSSSLRGFEIPPSSIGALALEAGNYTLTVGAAAGVEAGELWIWRQPHGVPVSPEEAP